MMSPRPMRGAPFQQGVTQSPGTPQRVPSLSSGVVNGAMSAQRQGRSLSPLGNDQPQGYVFQGAEQNPNPNPQASPESVNRQVPGQVQGVQGVQARRGLPRTSGNPYSVRGLNAGPAQPKPINYFGIPGAGLVGVGQQVQVARMDDGLGKTYSRAEAQGAGGKFQPTGTWTDENGVTHQTVIGAGGHIYADTPQGYVRVGLAPVAPSDAQTQSGQGAQGGGSPFQTSSAALTANPNPPGQVDPNQTAQPASNAPPVQTSNRINSNASQAEYDPLAGLSEQEQQALQKGAAANQMSIEEARALWDEGYRPEAYWGYGSDSYDSSWYRLDPVEGRDVGDELGMDADEGGRAMARNLLAGREADRKQAKEDQAQAEFDSLIERILGLEGPDITQALEASRMARENALNRGNRALYSSSMDPRAMQAAGAELNENLALQGAQQDAGLALQKEMMRYATQIDALKAAASLAGNVAQARKMNDVTMSLQERLASLAQQQALFERNLSTPSAGEILGGLGVQLAGGAASGLVRGLVG